MKKLILLLVLLTSCYCESIPVYQYSENIAEALQRGNYLWSKKQFDEAKIEFENVVLMDESNVKGLTGLFRCQLQLGELLEARRSMESIEHFSLDTKLVKQLKQQLDQAERLQDQMAAREFFDRQLQDFHSATATELPDTKTEEKKNIIRPAQALKTDTPHGKFAKAVQLHKKGFTTQAIPIFMDALMADGNLVNANDHGLFEAARSFYRKSVEANPKDIQSMLVLAWLWEHYTNQKRSIELYRQIKDAAVAGSNEYLLASGKIKEYEENEKAQADYQAEELERLKLDQERYRKIQISNGSNPDYKPEDYNRMGFDLLQKGDIPEAIIHLQGATKVDPSNPETHYNYAMAQMESAFNGNENGFSIAKRELEYALSLDPPSDLRQKIQNMLGSLETENQAGAR
jgi:tetratricopeptide (TPR) repeat protein